MRKINTITIGEIKFNQHYPKLWNQKSAELLAVKILSRKEVKTNKDLLEYDTKYIAKSKLFSTTYNYYNIRNEEFYIQLIFLGNKHIPFCTLRKFTRDKFKFYHDLIERKFKIVIEVG